MKTKTCNHSHGHRTDLQTPTGSVDPTNTKTLRKDYEASAYKRFRETKGDIRTAVIERDVLALSNKLPAQLGDVPEFRAFDFPTNDKKIKAFRDWIDTNLEQNVLEPAPNLSEHWQGDYVRRGYRSGLKQAREGVEYAGIPVGDESLQNIFNTPIHRNTLQTLYTRNFAALNKITQATGGEISRILSEGLIQGWNPNKTARLLNERVDKVGITRARTMARTETIYAHNEAALNEYERQGIKKVTAEVEWETAGDSRVCTQCQPMQGSTFTIKEAHGVIPLHPNCRCTWIPVPETFDRPQMSAAAAKMVYTGFLKQGVNNGKQRNTFYR